MSAINKMRKSAPILPERALKTHKTPYGDLKYHYVTSTTFPEYLQRFTEDVLQ
jgi:hypothetical protein